MKPTTALVSLSLGLFPFAACGGGGAAAVPTDRFDTDGDFVVRQTSPTSGAEVYLNDPIDIDFSQPLDLASATLQTIRFEAFDQAGHATGETVSGTFLLATSPGDAATGRRLRFLPRLPSDERFADGGLRPGRTYRVSLVGGTAENGTVLRETGGHGLAQPKTFEFRTVDGTQAAQLFRNPKSGGPRRTGFEVTPADDLSQVPLNLFGAPPLEVRLHFDQALNPSATNVPSQFDGNPLLHDPDEKGRLWLEYEDPMAGIGVFTWIPAEVALERNDIDGATVLLRPIGVLPNRALVRAVADVTLEDIAGEANVADLAYDPVFGTFRTDASYAPQWNGIAEDFRDHNAIDPTAAFPEAQAEVGPGFVRAGFAFEGNPTSLEYEPLATEVVLNTAFTQIQPKNGLPFTVSGGVFHFKNVRIPNGVNVLGQGPNPMVWLCSGTFTVEGLLSVRGGNGARVDTLNSANFAKAGGIGVCGGGNGGNGTPSAFQRDLRGDTGRGPLQVAGKGGRGGYHACVVGSLCGGTNGGGSGGGGGTLATQGDPLYRGTVPATIVPNVPPTANTAFQQVRGYGGSGCSGDSGTRTAFLTGGEPGDLVFVDTRRDNDFWGSAIRLSPNGNLRITGELTVPVGGGGGGGGGDMTQGFPACAPMQPDPAADQSGGGGGGGGGVLIVKALGDIVVTSTGRIVADGGHGGGGEQAGSANRGGGGGGGAGGMVVLMSATRIVLHAHGSAAQNRYTYGPYDDPTTAAIDPPFLDRDYDFVISADGGLTTTGVFGPQLVSGKYPASGVPMLAGTSYDTNPLGGLGGSGLIQLMVPPGTNADGTNTRLDDNVVVRRTLASGVTVELTGIQKQALLAWRGFPGPNGVGVDDFGGTTNYRFADPAASTGYAEGDLRPAPVLLPVPFSARSRVQSRWIDTGQSRRRELDAPDGLPAGVVGAAPGPVFEFAGIDPTPGPNLGFATFTTASGAAILDAGTPVVGPVAIAAASANEQHLGALAHRVTLAAPSFAIADRYVQYEAELLAADGARLAAFRIVHHTERDLWLDAVDGPLPAAAERLQVRARFFGIATNGTEGLGPVYTQVQGDGSVRVIPRANVRIGFAFHEDPRTTTNRYPADGQLFVHDLLEPGLQAWIQQHGAPRYVMYDVLFDLTYEDGSQAPALAAGMARPELRFLRLPFRF
ncbi:MAG: hypothetical protein JNL08_08870 [Planctomycetes bacterium]|nr:hypothetical protein [Planctomycetota bacterium]